MRADIYDDLPTISWVIKDCSFLNLSLVDGQSTYVIPLHFGYQLVNNQIVLYVHGQARGRRAALIKKNANASVAMTTDYHLIPAKKDCYFSATFRSVVGQGRVTELVTPQDKIHGLTVMMHHYVAHLPQALTPTMVKVVHIWKIVLTNASAKIHQPLPEWKPILAKFGHQFNKPDVG